MNATTYFAPTRPYSIVDAVNRMAVATGSCTRAMRDHHADYNGHFVVVERGDFSHGAPLHSEEEKERRGWRAHYTWSGINYLARSTNFADALAAGLREHGRGALGSSVRVHCHTPEQAAACEAAGLLPWSPEAEAAENAKWQTPLFDEVNTAFWYESKMGIPAIGMLTSSSTVEEFKAKVDGFLADRRAARQGTVSKPCC